MLLLLLAGCRTPPVGVVVVDDAATFCSGSARAEVNGMLATSPSLSLREDILNCCDMAGRVDVTSAQLPLSLTLEWRRYANQTGDGPFTLDLSSLAKSWSVMLGSNCDRTSGVCGDFAEALTGTLTVSRQNGIEYAEACVEAPQSSAPNPLLHSARLWFPNQAVK